MYKREFILLATLVLAVFATACGSAWYMTWLLQQEVLRLTADSLPGLLNAMTVRTRISENWESLQAALRAPTHKARTNLIAQIEANSVELLLNDIALTAGEPQEHAILKAMTAARAEFISKRGQVFELIKQQRLAEATRLFESDVTPSYARYQAAAREIFRHETESGALRAAKVAHLARLLPWLSGGLSLLIFIAGILFGLKAALGGLGLVSRLASVTAAKK